MDPSSKAQGSYLLETICKTCGQEQKPRCYNGSPSEYVFPKCSGCGDGVYESTFVSPIIQFVSDLVHNSQKKTIFFPKASDTKITNMRERRLLLKQWCF